MLVLRLGGVKACDGCRQQAGCGHPVFANRRPLPAIPVIERFEGQGVDANADLTGYASFRTTMVFALEALVNSLSAKAAESDQTGTGGNIGWQIDRQVRAWNDSSARLIWVSVSGVRVAFMSLPSVM